MICSSLCTTISISNKARWSGSSVYALVSPGINRPSWLCSLFSLVLTNLPERGWLSRTHYPHSEQSFTTSMFLVPTCILIPLIWATFQPNDEYRATYEGAGRPGRIDASKVGQIGISSAGRNGINRVRGSDISRIVCCNLQTDTDSRIHISIYILNKFNDLNPLE